MTIHYLASPIWPNLCEHDVKEYVATVTDRNGVPVVYDVYVRIPNKGAYPSGYGLCFRYGDGIAEYASPGDTLEFMKRDPTNSVYSAEVFEVVRQRLRTLGLLP